MKNSSLVVLIVLVVAIVGLFVMFLGPLNGDLVGQAGKIIIKDSNFFDNSKAPTKKSLKEDPTLKQRSDSQKTGCYLDLATKQKGGQINGGTEIGIFSYSQEDCYSLYLAFEFGNDNDALRIISKELKKTGYHHSKTIVQNELYSYPPNRVYVVKWKNYQKISPKGGPVVTMFQRPHASDHCTTLKFFGIPLYCFNEVVVSGVGKLKDEHFNEIIAPLTFLKMTGRDDMYDLFIGALKNPFTFLVQEKIVFVDGTKIIALNAHLFNPEELNNLLATQGNIEFMPIKEVWCQEEATEERPFGAANFQYRSPDFITRYSRPEHLTIDSDWVYATFWCKEKLLDQGGKPGDSPTTITQIQAEEPRMHYAGVAFHEGAHKFKPHEDVSCSGYDDDWDTVYGSHISYLFQSSEDLYLTCYERHFLYGQAQFEFDSKLCLEEHDYSSPSCVLPTDKQTKAEELAIKYARMKIDV